MNVFFLTTEDQTVKDTAFVLSQKATLLLPQWARNEERALSRGCESFVRYESLFPRESAHT